jgi:hypothetical protein
MHDELSAISVQQEQKAEGCSLSADHSGLQEVHPSATRYGQLGE